MAISFIAIIAVPHTGHASGLEAKSFLDREIECLAKNIYHEAGKESFEGKVAVAQVTVNRSEDERYPSTICNVVHQKTSFANKIICQFSWVCDKRKTKLNYEQWLEAREVAEQVLLDGLRLAKLKNALYFHNTSVSPNWGKVKVAKIGNHIFYSDKKRI